MTFTTENATGYTAAELATLNAEWAEIVAAEGLEPESDEYYDREKQFSDEVSKRTETMTTIRTLAATDGATTHELAVIQKADQTYWLHDVTADPNCDSLEQIQDASDTAVIDVIRDHGFEITD